MAHGRGTACFQSRPAFALLPEARPASIAKSSFKRNPNRGANHALLWENGKPIDLGNLGGHGWNTPPAINNRGVVTGFVNGPNDIVNGQLQISGWPSCGRTRTA